MKTKSFDYCWLGANIFMFYAEILYVLNLWAQYAYWVADEERAKFNEIQRELTTAANMKGIRKINVKRGLDDFEHWLVRAHLTDGN